MKFVLFSVVCLFAVVLAKPALKQKRDILPGDPRYGTDYHHHHHHHHENEVEAPQQGYGPPGYQPGEPIHVPAPQVGHVPAPTVHHQHQYQQTSVPIKPNKNLYLAPASESHHVHYTTQHVHTTPTPYYTTAVPHYSHAVPDYRPSVNVHNDYLPPDHGHQKSVEGPVTSYGTPVPDYQIPEVQAVEHHDHHVAQEKATVLGEVSTHVETVTAAPVVHHEEQIIEELHREEETVQEAPEQQEEQTYEAPVQTKVETYHHEAPVQQETHYHHEAPVQQEVHPVHQTHHHEAPVESHSHTETHTHVQPAVHTVKTVKEQVTHVQHAAPAVHHQPAVHHAVHQAVQPAVHRAVVQQTVHQQPAVQHHHQTYYQQPQIPQTYSNNYFGNAFENFGSGFESTYGTPNFQVSQVVPQVYNPDFSNTGFGYQETSNVFQHAQQHVQQPTYQVPQYNSHHRYVQPQQFPQQVTSFVQSQVLPQFPSYQETTHQVVQQPSVSTKSSTQLVDSNNGGYVY